MKKTILTLMNLLFLSFALGFLAAAQPESFVKVWTWRELPQLPLGLAGQFAGVSDNQLIVLGGTYWTTAPWAGGKKIWTGDIYALDTDKNAVWRKVGQLPLPVSYGASVQTKNGIICLGGQTADAVSAKVFRIKLNKDRIQIEFLPDLPQPLTNFAAVLLGQTIYVAGGQTSLSATAAVNTFYKLDLQNANATWQKLAPLPGAERILPVMAAQKNAVYVISGAKLTTSDDGKLKREYLDDNYRFEPETGWIRVADGPRPIVAGSAITLGSSQIVVFGGDDGANAQKVQDLKDNHPGFSREVLVFDAAKNVWRKAGDFPAGLVTTNALLWNKNIVIAGGEDRPGHRSARVISAPLVR